MLNYIISYFLTIFTALCTWVKIDVMSTIEKKLEEVGELIGLIGVEKKRRDVSRPYLLLVSKTAFLWSRRTLIS